MINLRNIIFLVKKKNFSIESKYFDFDSIEIFFRKKEKDNLYQEMSDRFVNDIDFKELFKKIDKTSSKIGQQYLYSKLLTIEEKVNFESQENLIGIFNKQKGIKEETVKILSSLNNSTFASVSTC
jgi:hypothetical protein